MTKVEIEQEFNKVFFASPSAIYRAPGRVNLIGEHVDYNGGEVLPFAISMEIIGAISIRNDDRLCCFSQQAVEQLAATPQSLEEAMLRNHWTTYVHGVIACLRRHGYIVPKGINFWFSSNLPVGAGLSSSAALEVLVLHLILDIMQIHLSKKEIALLAHEAENKDIGVHCGIMDQFAVALCKKNKALRINTETQQHEEVDLNLNNETEFILIDSRKRRSLQKSEYNQRFKECQDCLQWINHHLQTNYRTLADISNDVLLSVKSILPKTLFKRARHVVSEIQRTSSFIEAISERNYRLAGIQLTNCHHSLKLDYEVSCNELDDIVDSCLSAGAYGARLTGAGFGGCVIALFPRNKLQSALESIQTKYHSKYAMLPYIYHVKPVDGSGRWEDIENG